MSEHVYILGASRDLENLDVDFYLKNNTIGINRAYLRSDDLGVQMNEWIAFDRYYAFHHWVRANAAPGTRKWVWWEYVHMDTGDFFKKVEAGVPARMKNYKIQVYHSRPVDGDLSPAVTTPDSRFAKPVLASMYFTIFTAISMAMLLGFKDIRLRGVSGKGDYYGDTQAMNEERKVYVEPMLACFEKARPFLVRDGVTVINETPGTVIPVVI